MQRVLIFGVFYIRLYMMLELKIQKNTEGYMSDDRIVELFWQRSENAVEETKKQYGSFLYYISFGILKNKEDAEEIVNDTYLNAWNSIPPQKPHSLKAFLSKIVRNLSLNRIRDNSSQKRGGGEYETSLEELKECVSGKDNVENNIDYIFLTKIINEFLRELPNEPRRIFIKRYWYLLSVYDISNEMNQSESKVKSILMRTRKKLAEKLKEEGFDI